MNDFTVVSPHFSHGDSIPKKFTGDGQDTSPELRWEGIDGKAKAFAVICEDPDAPTTSPFIHWVLFNIPGSLQGIPEGVDKSLHPKTIPGALQGHNSWGKPGWNGPQPPKGHGTHHYHFKVFALDAPLTLAPDVDAKQLYAAMKGHVRGAAELIGTYERK